MRSSKPRVYSVLDYIMGDEPEPYAPKPWCDCERPTIGFTKRSDNVWVKPCCMRVTQTVWDKQGAKPVVLTEKEREELRERNKRATEELVERLLSQRKSAPPTIYLDPIDYIMQGIED